MSDSTKPSEPRPEKKPDKKPSANAPVAPPRGMSASVARKAVFGPEGPAPGGGARARLAVLLNLKAPSDQQLFEDAAREIESLRSKA